MKKHIVAVIMTILATIFIFFSLFFSGEIAEGIQNGLYISINHIVPSLFVFTIISNFIMLSPIKRYIFLPLKIVGKKLFKLCHFENTIFMLSLISGFPIGASLLAKEAAEGRINCKRASLMLSYCVNCGPAFLVVFVGAGVFSNSMLGIILFLSQTISSMLTAVAVSFFFEKGERNIRQSDPDAEKSYGFFLISSVRSSASSMFTVCVFITAFCGILPVIKLMLSSLPPDISVLLSGLTEVTSGVRTVLATERISPLILASIFTSFGGLCVLLQISALLHNSGISMKYLLLFRIPHCIVSTVTALALADFFGISTECIAFSSGKRAILFSVSPFAAVSLFLLVIILLFFCRKADKIVSKK